MLQCAGKEETKLKVRISDKPWRCVSVYVRPVWNPVNMKLNTYTQ